MSTIENLSIRRGVRVCRLAGRVSVSPARASRFAAREGFEESETRGYRGFEDAGVDSGRQVAAGRAGGRVRFSQRPGGQVFIFGLSTGSFLVMKTVPWIFEFTLEIFYSSVRLPFFLAIQL